MRPDVAIPWIWGGRSWGRSCTSSAGISAAATGSSALQHSQPGLPPLPPLPHSQNFSSRAKIFPFIPSWQHQASVEGSSFQKGVFNRLWESLWLLEKGESFPEAWERERMRLGKEKPPKGPCLPSQDAPSEFSQLSWMQSRGFGPLPKPGSEVPARDPGWKEHLDLSLPPFFRQPGPSPPAPPKSCARFSRQLSDISASHSGRSSFKRLIEYSLRLRCTFPCWENRSVWQPGIKGVDFTTGQVWEREEEENRKRELNLPFFFPPLLLRWSSEQSEEGM